MLGIFYSSKIASMDGLFGEKMKRIGKDILIANNKSHIEMTPYEREYVS